jgi:hypothetical protein
MNAQAIEWYFQHLDQQGMALLAENYAWVDERLENAYLQEQNQVEAEEEEEQPEDDLLDEVVAPMVISEDAAVVPMVISDDEYTDYDDMPHLIDDDSSDDEYQLVPIQLFPAMDDDLVPDMALLQLPGPPVLRRSNTIVYQNDNVTVYNGNPNGSRFFDHNPDADDE